MATLTEVLPFEYTFTEATKEQRQNGVLGSVKGIFQRAGVKNANNRVYSESLWKSQLTNESVKDRLNNRAMVGELDHPSTGITSMSKVSHVITGATLNPDGIVEGTADILDTPMGRIAETLLRANVRVGISSRGDGTVTNKKDASHVNEADYRLETWDLVLKPSTPGAYVSLSEQQIEHDKTILTAINRLVASTEDRNILQEAAGIVTTLEHVDSSERLLTQSAITEKLNNNRSINQGSDDMSQDTKVGADNARIESLAKDLAAKQLAEAKAETLEGKVADLTSKLEESAGLVEKTQKRCDAAEQLSEELLSQLNEAKTKLEEAEAVSQRKEAAEALLAESLQQLEGLKDIEKRYQAAKDLLEAIQAKAEADKLEAHKSAILTQVPEAAQKAVQNILAECTTADAADKAWANLKQLTDVLYEDAKEPLPHQAEETTTPDPDLNRIDENTEVTAGKSIVSYLLNQAQV